MAITYGIGRRVIVKPAKSQNTPRDAGLERHAGKTGVVANYYHIQPTGREVFCLYVVKLKDEDTELVLYEDELAPLLE